VAAAAAAGSAATRPFTDALAGAARVSAYEWRADAATCAA
jgi:hypothetical protein